MKTPTAAAAPSWVGGGRGRPSTAPGDWECAVVTGVTKRYGATTALDDVEVEFHSGSVHGLIGQNGAGKSTLIKVLAGLVRPDSGHLELDDQRIEFGTADQARNWPVSTAFQELTLIPHLSVAENLVLGRESQYRVRSFEATVRAAAGILERWQVSDIDPRQPVSTIPLPVRQRLEIVRALERTRRVLLLDEPTSALDPAGADWLKDRIREQRDRGVAIIVVSHRLAEIEDVCDRVTVLRDGNAVASLPREGLDAGRIAALMLGRELLQTQTALSRQHAANDVAREEAIGVRGLSVGMLHDVTFTAHRGEILGIAGLEGQGQHELFTTMFGARRPTSGMVLLDGAPARLTTPKKAIAAGVGMVPEDRKTEGLMLHRSIRENLTLTALRKVSVAGLMSARRERRASVPVMASLGLAARAYHRSASALSGGNQQKAVAAKWLLAQSRVLLMYDPLRGVDVGARQEFFTWMTDFAESGGSIVFYSSDIDELTAVCDRIVTIYRGRVTGFLDSKDATRRKVLDGMLGADE